MKQAMLVIEGDEAVAKLFAKIFSDRNWDVDTPRNGRAVVEALLGSKSYSIILVSYQFSAVNGVEIIGLIREFEHFRNTPVLLVTGRGDATCEAISAGADGVLHKPIEVDRFFAAVMGHLSSTCPVARGSDRATSGEGRGNSLERLRKLINACN